MNLWMSRLIQGSEEGRSKAAVTHLALARSQNTRTGILGFYKRFDERQKKNRFSVKYKSKRSCRFSGCSFFLSILIYRKADIEKSDEKETYV